MPHIPHSLHDEFPDDAGKIRALRATNAHFLRLCEEYEDLNRAIHRAETRVEPVSEFHEAHLRKQRLILKDEVARILALPMHAPAGGGEPA